MERIHSNQLLASISPGRECALKLLSQKRTVCLSA